MQTWNSPKLEIHAFSPAPILQATTFRLRAQVYNSRRPNVSRWRNTQNPQDQYRFLFTLSAELSEYRFETWTFLDAFECETSLVRIMILAALLGIMLSKTALLFL